MNRIVDGGELNLATDDPAYALQIAEVLAAEPRLENVYAPDPYRRDSRGRSPTAYELEWKSIGRTCCYFAYCKRAPESATGSSRRALVDTSEGPA